jgi:hypothetical protein
MASDGVKARAAVERLAAADAKHLSGGCERRDWGIPAFVFFENSVV